jgi:RNA polymerase sigma-70 factor, ECF subfamily
MTKPGSGENPDRNLIESSQNGDPAAWEALVTQYQEPVFRLAYLFLGDPEEAKDIAQEAFLRAWKALETFDKSRPIRPWLLSIAANLAKNRRRSIGRYLQHLYRAATREPGTTWTVEERAQQNLESNALWEAVRRLHASDQEVIYLRYFLELSIEDAAAASGVASGTVKSRLHRAMERLRAIIQQDFPILAAAAEEE